MGADIVIAVNIGTPLLPRDKLQTLFNISQQMVNILTEQNVHAQKALLRPQDILIEPDLRDIGFLDFDRAKEASLIGEQATLAMVEKLSELHLSGHLFVASQQMRLNPQLPTIRIGFVDIQTNGAIPEQDIRRQLSIEIGSIYNAETINRKLAILNNAREFDSIGHELVQRDQQYGLRITANGRNWGPHFVRFGLSLSSGFDGVGGYRLQVGHRRPWLTPGGLEWRNDIELGNTVKLHSELRQPLFEREGMYLAPYAEFSQDSFNTYIDNTRVAEFGMRTIKAGNDLAFRIGEQSVLGEARIGFLFSQYNITPKLGMVQLTDVQGNSSSYPLAHTTLQQFGLRTSVVIDQLSDSSFPRDGYKLGGSLFAGLDKSKTNFQELALDSVWAHSWSNHSVNLKFSGAGLFVKDSGANQTMGPTLGGFQRLSAYQQDQFRGNYMLYGSATYLLRAVNFEMAGQSLFLGTSLELGNTWDTGKEITAASLRKSLSVFAGFNSFMGPIYLGFAVGQNGSKNVFFQLGRQ